MSFSRAGTGNWAQPGSRSGRSAFSIKETAEQLGTSQASIWRAIKRGELKAVKLGGRSLIPALSIEKLLSADAA